MYNKYAVAVCKLFKGTNQVKIVEATSYKNAVILAVGDDIDDMDSVLGELTLEQTIEYYSEGELIVSHPIELPY